MPCTKPEETLKENKKARESSNRLVGAFLLATAVATIVSVTTVIFTTTVAQEDQHQYDDGNQYPVVVKAITKTH